MPAAPIISYAQNREDVVLWRALHHVRAGRYVEMGVRNAHGASTTRVLSEHGWAGGALVTQAEVADARRRERPNERIELVGDDGDAAGVEAALKRVGYARGDVNLLVIHEQGDVGPAVPTKSRLLGLRPWVVVVSSASETSPRPHWDSDGWDDDVLTADYEPCLFDGVSRFYVANERNELRASLSYPACVRDRFTDAREAELADEVARLETAVQEARDQSIGELLRWRHAAVNTWAKTAASRVEGATPKDYQQLRVALAAAQRDAAEVRQTMSWKVTRPLRMVKSAGRRR